MTIRRFRRVFGMAAIIMALWLCSSAPALAGGGGGGGGGSLPEPSVVALSVVAGLASVGALVLRRRRRD